jgi:hypothetical protein
MLDQAEDGKRIRGQRLDMSILRHLRRMIKYCRDCNRREMRWYYEAGWEFASTKIYGPLPPRPEYNLRGLNVSAEPPQQVVTPWPPGMPRPAKMPLRKIVRRFVRSHNSFEYTYETLECAHILMGPVGYSVPAKSRRCPHCAIAAILKKKSVAGVTRAARSKAVGA